MATTVDGSTDPALNKGCILKGGGGETIEHRSTVYSYFCPPSPKKSDFPVFFALKDDFPIYFSVK